jgi:hypothetical protein
MVVIRMDALAEVYINYKFTLSFIKREKAIEDGINKILLRLNRYKRDPVIYTLSFQGEVLYSGQGEKVKGLLPFPSQ